jgi:hypothetical protein
MFGDAFSHLRARARGFVSTSGARGTVATLRFGKSLDLPLLFSAFEFFPWPAALYLIFKNDAEFSFFQAPFDVFGKCIQTPILINSKAIGCTRTGTADYSDVADCSKNRSTEYAEITDTVIQLGVPRDMKIVLANELKPAHGWLMKTRSLPALSCRGCATDVWQPADRTNKQIGAN